VYQLPGLKIIRKAILLVIVFQEIQQGVHTIHLEIIIHQTIKDEAIHQEVRKIIDRIPNPVIVTAEIVLLNHVGVQKAIVHLQDHIVVLRLLHVAVLQDIAEVVAIVVVVEVAEVVQALPDIPVVEAVAVAVVTEGNNLKNY
jgi:hypothetical protein